MYIAGAIIDIKKALIRSILIKLIFLKIPNYILWFDNVCDTISSAENFEIKKVKREVRYEHNKKEWYRGCF